MWLRLSNCRSRSFSKWLKSGQEENTHRSFIVKSSEKLFSYNDKFFFNRGNQVLLHWSQTIQSIVCLLHHSILLLVSFHVLCRDRALKRDLIKQTTSVVNCISIIKSRNAQNSYLNTLIIQSFTGISFPTPRQIIASCHPIQVKKKC